MSDLENTGIPSIFEIRENAKEVTETINKWYYILAKKQQKSSSLFIPFGDVYVLPRILRCYRIAVERNWFDEDIDLGEEANNYVNGFKTGYIDFLKDSEKCLPSYKEDVFSAIEYLPLKHGYYPYGWRDDKIIPKYWDELGKTIGCYYCAWCIVLKSQSYFEPLFKEYFNSKVKNTESYKDCELKIKTLVETLAGQVYKPGKTIINPKIKEPFIKLLTNPNPYQSIKKIVWQDSDWKLYGIVKLFIQKSFLPIDEIGIPKFMLDNFIFKGRKGSKAIKGNKAIKDSYKRAESLKESDNGYNDFFTALELNE